MLQHLVLIDGAGYMFIKTMLWLKRLVAGLSLWRLGSVHVGFVVDKMSLAHVFL
jgi:hypothetical protein